MGCRIVSREYLTEPMPKTQIQDATPQYIGETAHNQKLNAVLVGVDTPTGFVVFVDGVICDIFDRYISFRQKCLWKKFQKSGYPVTLFECIR